MNDLRERLTSRASSESVVLGIICLSVFSTALDQTVVVAALPIVMVDLEIPLTDLDRASWIITAFLVSYYGVHAVGRASVRRVWPRQECSSWRWSCSRLGRRLWRFRRTSTGLFRRGCVPGNRRWRDGPHRPGHGSGGRIA